MGLTGCWVGYGMEGVSDKMSEVTNGEVSVNSYPEREFYSYNGSYFAYGQ